MSKTGLTFEKMVASGNDFILLDNYENSRWRHAKMFPAIVRRLCARKFSVGADGVLVIEPSVKGDFKMRIFNPDGNEVEMCGNGSRCVAFYAARRKIASSPMSIQTRAGLLQASVRGAEVKVRLPEPKDIRINFVLRIDNKNYRASYINTSVPHAVLFFKNIDNLDVFSLGRKVRHHKRFRPQGSNADFVKLLNRRNIAIRTYERGVEDETLSCGTGAVASAIISALKTAKGKDGSFKIKVHTKSKEILKVYFKVVNKAIKDVFLEGRVKSLYRGKVNL